MVNRRIHSKSAFEEKARYARAVVCDDWVIVSGTMGTDPETGDMPAGFRAQADNSFTTIETALAEAGASLADVVRCGVYLVQREDVSALIDVLAEKFDHVRPANTTIMCELPDPNALFEIEVMARLTR